jgi:hypothetical protein
VALDRHLRHRRVVSPYTKPGHISHTYADHVAILKFIESNWSLPKISGRSHDNLRNPTTTVALPYVPDEFASNQQLVRSVLVLASATCRWRITKSA